jgi:hypothetical protein
MAGCICYGTFAETPPFYESVAECAVCLEKGDNVISSKMYPDFYIPYCRQQTSTYQFVGGIYELGVFYNFPINLPFGALCNGNTESLPWPKNINNTLAITPRNSQADLVPSVLADVVVNTEAQLGSIERRLEIFDPLTGELTKVISHRPYEARMVSPIGVEKCLGKLLGSHYQSLIYHGLFSLLPRYLPYCTVIGRP